MTPLQKIAMGVVFLVLKAEFGAGWDALPDPVGWLLVLAGTWAAREHLPNASTLLALGGLAFVGSAATYPPQVVDDLDPAALWLLQLPHPSYAAVLCFGLVGVLGRDGRWFRLLAWAFVAAALLPAAAIATDDPVVADVTQVTLGLAQLVLVWQLFAHNRRPEAGGFPRPVRQSPHSGT